MSIVSTVVSLSLFSSPVMATGFNAKVGLPEFSQSERVAQVPLNQYNDRIQEGREELTHLISIVRNHPKLSAKEKAVGVFRLYKRRAEVLHSNVKQGLDGVFMTTENKITILNRWKAERDEMEKLASQEIEPYLTARQRKIRAIFSDPAQVKLLLEQSRRQAEAEDRKRKDAEALRDIIPNR
jgi:hypothetical protein